jgi:1-deoxy-D-xylulose-5-phosphate synthase
VLECLQQRGIAMPALQLGVPDRFIEHGSREDNLRAAGLDAAAIAAAVEAFWRSHALPRALPAG